jgi:hypothetical protein
LRRQKKAEWDSDRGTGDAGENAGNHRAEQQSGRKSGGVQSQTQEQRHKKEKQPLCRPMQCRECGDRLSQGRTPKHPAKGRETKLTSGLFRHTGGRAGTNIRDGRNNADTPQDFAIGKTVLLATWVWTDESRDVNMRQASQKRI